MYNGEVSITNTFGATKLVMDNNCTISSSTIADEINAETIRNISQLYDAPEVGSFWVLSKIVAFQNIGDWCYLSCNRYKVTIRVSDATGNAAFQLWDRECNDLFGKSASELKKSYVEDEMDSFPPEMNVVVHQTLLFKVQVKPEHLSNFYGSWTVMKLCREPGLISKVRDSMVLESQELSSRGEVTTPIKDLKKDVDVEIIGSGSSSNSIKRTLNDSFSSNVEKKSKSIVKIEKP
ncbi:uncharacterized protein LOC116015860 [Ipomoea triloba]|uniref:uncharacterized protein LOC116015860 n=1 Tax=Ipomoea triloba TaxID=35885 RepID=UPI00125E2430|nr:uncharacterized protein LOC116015860 [Ipomoea triloba]